MTSPEQRTEQRFGPTTGAISGVIGMVLVVAVIVLSVLNERTLFGLRVDIVAALFGWLIWCFMLRPRVILGADDVRLRNALVDTKIPLARVTDVSMGTVTAVFVGGERYVGIAVGHSVRTLMRHSAGRRSRGDTGDGPITALSGRLLGDKVPDFVAQQINQASIVARTAGQSTEPVQRRPAVPEFVVLVVLVVALVASFLL